MNTGVHSRDQSSLLDLIRRLPDEIKVLVQRETELAKTELKENFSRLGKRLGLLAVGGVIALIGATFLFAGFSLLIAWGLEKLGASQLLAECLGFGAVALIACGVGYAIISVALGRLAKTSLKPEKTINIFQAEEHPRTNDGKDGDGVHSQASSEEIKEKVNESQTQVAETVTEIKEHLSPRYMIKEALPRQITGHPVRSLMIGAGTGVAGFVYWKMRHNKRHVAALVQRRARRRVGKAQGIASLIVPLGRLLLK